MRRERRRGNMVLETVLFIPVLLLLVVGMVQIGKITYVYYTLKKTLYTAGRYIATSQGVNFCDGQDTIISNAKNYALTGTVDASLDSQIPNLTPDMITVQTECYDPGTQGLGECSTTGCDNGLGIQRPDFIVISIPDGYPMQPRIPYILLEPIPLKPSIRIPFGGTS